MASSRAPAAVRFTRLTLLHSWRTYSGARQPAVADISGIVTFKGVIDNGSSSWLFTLPRAFRPARNVYIATALCGATKGRLVIAPSGVVTVEAEGGVFANAQCATELDGLSFAKSAASFTKLKLQNGWKNGPFGTSAAAVRLISGVVHFKGAIFNSNTNPKTLAFTLPRAFRPAAQVRVPVDLCSANKGDLYIKPNGTVRVYGEFGQADAACFTSLDGVTFAKSGSGFTALKLQNHWQNYGLGAAKAAVRLSGGIVRFRGAIKTSLSNNSLFPFTLPKGLRPAHFVYIEVNLCGETNGRLYIPPSGVVEVYAEGGNVFNAKCFTSLDGAWFAR